MVVVCLPEFFKNIPTVCFGFVVLRLLVTRDRLPNMFEFLKHAQHEMSSRLAFLFLTYQGRSKETLLAEYVIHNIMPTTVTMKTNLTGTFKSM